MNRRHAFRSSLLALLAALGLGPVGVQAADISGAGATFPYPIYAKWADAYAKSTGVHLNYQSIGSGGGIEQIIAKTVDFGASDAPLEPEELEKNGLVQFPMIIGGVVPVLNVTGIAPGELRLTGAQLADIYLGAIKRWNDPGLVQGNPGVALPDRAITVVHRADGSGTTWIFTNYLQKVSQAWSQRVGFGKAVSWPTGVGGKGNEGVASYVGRIQGSIGYVEYAYALENHMTHAKLRNAGGQFVDPTSAAFQASAANADWAQAPGYYLVLTEQPGAITWPISGASFILMQKAQEHPERAVQVLQFFDWAYHHGDAMAEELHYVPIPANVVSLVEATWREKIRDTKGQPVWTGKMSGE
jgi:phosphate transport system substrate-binding protein